MAHINSNNNNNKKNNPQQVSAMKADGTNVGLPVATTANRNPLAVGNLGFFVLEHGAPDLKGQVPAVGTAVKARFNPFYVRSSKAMPLKPGDVVFGKVTVALEPAKGPAWRGFVEPICKLPVEMVQNPGFICFAAASGLFPNFELLREDHGYDWASLRSAVQLDETATLSEIAAAAFNRLAAGTIGLKTIEKGIVKSEPKVIETEPAPAGADNQVGDLVGLHADGIIVACADQDTGTSYDGAYANGATRDERKAAAAVPTPKHKTHSDARKRHKATGKNKGNKSKGADKSADTGKDKGKGGKRNKK